MKLLGALAVGLLLAGPVSAQDLDKGLAAYESGDYAIALKELLPLAEGGISMVEQGSLIAKEHLILMYKNGYGVPKDIREAQKWLVRSALDWTLYTDLKYNEGNDALKNQDFASAERNYRLAAELKYTPALIALCLMYKDGHSVPPNYVVAHMWCDLVAVDDDEGASDLLLTIAKEMTPDQIAEAQRRARVCMASNYQDCD